MQIMNNNSVRIMWGHTSLGVILALFFFYFPINERAKLAL